MAEGRTCKCAQLCPIQTPSNNLIFNLIKFIKFFLLKNIRFERIYFQYCKHEHEQIGNKTWKNLRFYYAKPIGVKIKQITELVWFGLACSPGTEALEVPLVPESPGYGDPSL